jgi:hypothetical protein
LSGRKDRESISRPLLAACYAALAVAFGGSAYAVGSGSAPSQDDAQSAMATARVQSLDAAQAAAQPKARSAASVVGMRLGRRTGLRLGSKRGKREGAREKARLAEQAAKEQAELEAAAPPMWCDTDGYCLQQSQGGGGAACPPGTVENAGGVVCVPRSMIKP